jgi:chromatin remodeling complex protein RSC6
MTNNNILKFISFMETIDDIEDEDFDSSEYFDFNVVKNMTSTEKFNCILVLTNSLKLDYLKELKPPRISGFDSPIEISDELAEFMEKPQGEAVSRMEVTRKVSIYIKEHRLQDPEKRTNILPDEKLKKLFKIDDNTEPLTYTSIQKLLTLHYIRKN